MKTIHKFQLGYHPHDQRIPLELPLCANPLHFERHQNGILTLWCELDPKKESTIREFAFFGTGGSIPNSFEYIGTILDSGFEWHLYECKEEVQ